MATEAAGIKHFDIIRTPVITEKSARASETGTYSFNVDKRASKTEIRQSIEKVFAVKVDAIRTISYPGKPKRVGRSFGRRDQYKKAYVTLKEGFSIKVVEGL
jgi:large subunit ribosomal protein L23